MGKKIFYANVKALKKSTVMLSELEEMVKTDSYKELVAVVEELISEGALKPINKKATNGMTPPLCVKYRIIREKEDLSELYKEIRHLHPDINISKCLEKPQLYKKRRDVLLTLSDFLKNNAESLEDEMSRNERSYHIWGDEKKLEKVEGWLLEFLKDVDLLNYYPTPEPFFDYIAENREGMTILILENKDTWYTLRRLFRKNPQRRTLFGHRIDALLYGEGNKATQKEMITDYVRSVTEKHANFLYFGDLDYMGIDMFNRVCEVNPTLNIQLFHELYEEMLRLGKGRVLGKIRKKQSENVDINRFLSYFSEADAMDMKRILTNRTYIPQEILNNPTLRGLLKDIVGSSY